MKWTLWWRVQFALVNTSHCIMCAGEFLFSFYMCIEVFTSHSTLKDCSGNCWAEAPIKIARMTLTIKLDGNWSSFQLANSAPPLSVTDSAIAPSARMFESLCKVRQKTFLCCFWWVLGPVFTCDWRAVSAHSSQVSYCSHVRHRSHFGSRYKSGCCGHASLFAKVDPMPAESLLASECAEAGISLTAIPRRMHRISSDLRS